MLRKVFLLLLLVVFWAVVLLPLTLKPSRSPGSFSFVPAGQARPAERLPVPWENAQRATVRVADGSTDSANYAAPDYESAAPPVTDDAMPPSAPSSNCGSTYTIQRGDSLGKIAKTCGVTLSNLLAANPTIQNPNRIYPGQQINIPSGRGGADTLVELPSLPAAGSASFYPGALLEVQAAGLPPDTGVRVGIGLSISGYHSLGTHMTDAQGNLTISVVVPDHARMGEAAFILVTTHGVPARQAISEKFTIQ